MIGNFVLTAWPLVTILFYQPNTHQSTSNQPNSLWEDSATVKFKRVNALPDHEVNAMLLGIVDVFYQSAVITEAMHQTLSNEVSTGSLITIDSLFSRMESLSFEVLPDSVQALFGSNTYVAVPPRGDMFPGEHRVPDGYQTVVDYLLARGILNDNCKDLLDEYLFLPSFALDLLINDGTLNHVFIQLFTHLKECNGAVRPYE